MTTTGTAGVDLLDNVVWASMTGPLAHLAEVRGQAGRFPAGLSPFVGLADSGERSWADLAALAGPGAVVVLMGPRRVLPAGWERLEQYEGVQMLGEAVAARPDPAAQVLGPDDVPDMLALVARAQPGPFGPRTHGFGTYLGIRREGVLVAMAGERLRPPGWTEISAVCTDSSVRGQGLASRLIGAVAAVIRDRGDTPFLQALATNPAVGLYESLGFTHHAPTTFTGVRVPLTS